MASHSSVFLQLGIGILLIAFSNNFQIDYPIDEFAAEVENIMNAGDNGTFKFNNFENRFYDLMPLAESMSDHITKFVNASDAQVLFNASKKLIVLLEKVKNFNINSKSDNAKPKQSAEQSPKEKNAEDYRRHVLVVWRDTANYPLVTLNNEIWDFLRRNMTEVKKLSDICTRQSSSPAWSATDHIAMIHPMVRAQVDVYGPDSLDGIYALFARNLLKLTFYQAICDPILALYTYGAPFYRNSGYRVTMNKIFVSMDDAVKWSKAEYEADIQQLIATNTERNNVGLHINFSFGAAPRPTKNDPAKPKKAFLDALAPNKKIAKKNIKAKAKRRKYLRGTYLKINGRRAEAGEAVTIDLRKPETYESASEKGDESYVIHPLLVAFEEPEFEFEQKNPFTEEEPIYDPSYSTEINEVVLWPGQTVSYEVYFIPFEYSKDSTFSVAEKQLIESVMLQFEQHTCIRFKPKWLPTQHHVSLSNTPGKGCCSMPGMAVGNGSQIFNLESNPSCMDDNVIVHELMHAAGLHHTHQRADRDKHVTVHWDYVDPKFTSEFMRLRNYIPTVPYDERSVMHYPSSIFVNPQLNGPTMTNVNGQQLQSEQKLQLGDWHQLNVLYDCTNYLQ